MTWVDRHVEGGHILVEDMVDSVFVVVLIVFNPLLGYIPSVPSKSITGVFMVEGGHILIGDTVGSVFVFVVIDLDVFVGSIRSVPVK